LCGTHCSSGVVAVLDGRYVGGGFVGSEVLILCGMLGIWAYIVVTLWEFGDRVLGSNSYKSCALSRVAAVGVAGRRLVWYWVCARYGLSWLASWIFYLYGDLG